ncbi:phosphosulfolactate synthase [Paenibacillus caui]|uniref:phosphosulfolactate synthase n=1 Tax=Paenibacillus caui TaxID=2873927 RepID=UPI001CA8A5E0|nr:phosphosulfolactate synthase [Paenibacillus caui]
MMNSGLLLPERPSKPRQHGITALIDNGVPVSLFRDTIESAAPYIDFVKFGWGTSVVTPYLEQKISCLRVHQVDFYFGGTLFEKYLSQNKLDEYHLFCERHNASYIEISNGTIGISNREKAKYIYEFGKNFNVISEVGHKDAEVSVNQSSAEWIESIQEDLESGAHLVLTEARESGTSGICNGKGDLRLDLIDDILKSDIPLNKMMFEAPNKKLQTRFIKMAGSNVNLANIPFSDSLALETLRLGLRSDTFYLVE